MGWNEETEKLRQQFIEAVERIRQLENQVQELKTVVESPHLLFARIAEGSGKHPTHAKVFMCDCGTGVARWNVMHRCTSCGKDHSEDVAEYGREDWPWDAES